ncbi:MAG TPA: alpha/beta hydrolase [Pseudonocardia sp.]|nr:alpha/beta hydrolase [Pseudonocardia sp.]
MPEALNLVATGPDDGPPVLALHGVTGHAQRWRVLTAELPHLRWLAVDLRGHGHSPWTPPWGIEQHVADLTAVADRLALRRFTLLGHSFGAAIAVHLAHALRPRVERLVLLDPAIGLDPQDMLETAEQSRADESYADLAAARADRAGRWAGVADDLVEAELTAHLVRDGDRWRYRYCRSAVVAAWSEMARPARVPPAGLPTLLVPGKQADYVALAWVDACRAALGEHLTVAEVDAGHMVYLERPAEVAALIRGFCG